VGVDLKSLKSFTSVILALTLLTQNVLFV